MQSAHINQGHGLVLSGLQKCLRQDYKHVALTISSQLDAYSIK